MNPMIFNSSERNDTQIILNHCYPLLQNVLLDAFNISTIYFTPPYADIDKIDMGIRSIVWPSYNSQLPQMQMMAPALPRRILVIKSNLGFYNVLIFWNITSRPDFISIGPFRTDQLSPNYFTDILKEAHIKPSTLQGMKQIYESMPQAQLDAVMNVTTHILSAFLPEFSEITPELLQYSEQNRAIEINTDILERNLIQAAEQYSNLLSAYLRALQNGDNSCTKKAMHTFLKETKITVNKNMHDYKILLHSLNYYSQLTLFATDIHPSHILKQSTTFTTKINNATTISQLESMPDDICRKYSLLVKNYANNHYSKLTKDTVAYIQLHLEEVLNLNQLADFFGKNPSVLSHTFHQETGQTLTSFIQETRIQEALRLLNTTNLSISEVAMNVGYHDFSYFSKIFTRIVGMSPREYKQQR